MGDHVVSLPPTNRAAREAAFEARRSEKLTREGNLIVRPRMGRMFMATQVVIVPRAESPPIAASVLALSAISYVGNEDTVIPFTIIRTGGYAQIVSVDWAIASPDVTPNSGTVTFRAGEGEKEVRVTAGSIDFSVSPLLYLSNATTAGSGGVSINSGLDTATFNITNVTPATIELSFGAAAYAGDENTNINFAINRVGEEATDIVTVDWGIVGATTVPSAGTVTFNIGEIQQTVTVAAQLVTATEVGSVALSNPINLSGGAAPTLVTPLTATFTVIDVVAAPVTAAIFPRLGVMAIGGWGGVGLDSKPGGMPGRVARIAAHHIAVLGIWRTWVYSGSTGPAKDTSDICLYIKTFNPDVILYDYSIPTDVSVGRQFNIEPYIVWSNNGDPDTGGKGTAEHWWLYDGSGFLYSTDVKFATGVFDDPQVNLGSNSLDGTGITCAQWWARAYQANSGDSGDWATSGFGIRSEYGFDGIYQDIMRFEPRTAGDFDEDGNEELKDTPTALAFKSQGDHRYHAEYALLEPTFLHSGNYTQNPGVGNLLDEYALAIGGGYQNFVNGVFLEQCLGRSSSIETFSGWDAVMRYYKRAMTLNEGMDPQHTFFDNWETDGFSEDDPNIWDTTHSLYDWGRYGLCSCLQDNGYYGYPTSGGYVDVNILDEYSFNLGDAIDAPKYDGSNPLLSNSGSGYNAFESGVHLREFDNGIAIVNPKGNGQQTITLPSAGVGSQWDRLDATDYDSQDIGVNDGATNITSQTLPERHGIIIKRTALPIATTFSFPRTGLYSQGYWNPAAMDTKGGLNVRLGLMAKYKYCIFGNVRAWSYTGIDGGPFYVRDLPAMTKALSTVDTKCFMYVKSVEMSRASTADQYEKSRIKLDAEFGPNGDWWLRDYQDCHVSSFPVVMKDCGEIASTWRTNTSDLTTPDSRGMRYTEWIVRLDHYDPRYGDDPGDWDTRGDGLHSEDGWGGIFIDVMKASGKVEADWNGDGSDSNRYAPEVIEWVTKGHVAHVAAWRAIEPTFVITGNFAGNASQLSNYNLVPPRFFDLLEGPNSEWMAGSSASHEYWAVNENEMMLYYKRIMSFNTISRAAGTQTYELVDCKAFTGYIGSHTLVSWTRYMLCFTLQDDGFLSMTDHIVLEGFPLICNEFDLDMGQALEPPNYDSSNSGYVSYQDGVYKREFFNSSTSVGYIALWNPKNNGQQTITLPVYSGYQWNRLGTADFPDPVEEPLVNDGAIGITTQTTEARTGIIIKRVAASFGVIQGSTTNLPAFPGLRGHGYDSVHGSGRHLGTPATTVLYVDTLASDISNTDSTHGSLRWCLEQTFPRVIVPAISGVISYPADTVIDILDPYLTYAGQCAPGDGLHIHRCSLQPSSKEMLFWHWSGFMQDATSQGVADNIQLGTNNSTIDQTNLIVANCGSMYGMDQSMSSFNSADSYVSNYTFWQCLIGSSILGGFSKSYATLFDNTNISPSIPKGAILRSYMSNCARRNPRIASGVFESSNNFVNDADFYLEFESRDGATIAAASEMNFRGNGFVRGAEGSDFEPILFEDAGEPWDTGGYYHEGGNVKESTITSAMVNNSTGDSIQGTPSSVATPDGWVVSPITDSDAGLLEFHSIMDLHVGPRPSARLTVYQAEINLAANHLNSTTPVASRLTSAPNPPTVSSVAINHETTGSHGLGVIPTTGKDVVQASGYTLLEEWLHDHHAFFMPIGWDL